MEKCSCIDFNSSGLLWLVSNGISLWISVSFHLCIFLPFTFYNVWEVKFISDSLSLFCFFGSISLSFVIMTFLWCSPCVYPLWCNHSFLMVTALSHGNFCYYPYWYWPLVTMMLAFTYGGIVLHLGRYWPLLTMVSTSAHIEFGLFSHLYWPTRRVVLACARGDIGIHSCWIGFFPCCSPFLVFVGVLCETLMEKCITWWGSVVVSCTPFEHVSLGEFSLYFISGLIVPMELMVLEDPANHLYLDGWSIYSSLESLWHFKSH